jgi:hypothetical protein
MFMHDERELDGFCRRLRFPDALEEEFRSDYDQRAIPATRAALAIAVLLYAAFGILDFWGLPLETQLAWFIRYGIVCPLTTAALLLTLSRSVRGVLQLLLSIVVCLAGLGIVAMIGASSPAEPAFTQYYAGLISWLCLPTLLCDFG